MNGQASHNPSFEKTHERCRIRMGCNGNRRALDVAVTIEVKQKHWRWRASPNRSQPSVQWSSIAITLELLNTGDLGAGAEVRALVEHALSGRPGDWRVSIVGSRENDSWEMKILGPNGFERSYTLVGSAGEHQPLVIANVLQRLLPARVARG
jgi:hypothetical protein